MRVVRLNAIASGRGGDIPLRALRVENFLEGVRRALRRHGAAPPAPAGPVAPGRQDATPSRSGAAPRGAWRQIHRDVAISLTWPDARSSAAGARRVKGRGAHRLREIVRSGSDALEDRAILDEDAAALLRAADGLDVVGIPGQALPVLLVRREAREVDQRERGVRRPGEPGRQPVPDELAAAAGLSVLLATSAAAFTIVKWCGAAYLLYAGIRLVLASVRAPRDAGIEALLPPASPLRIFREAFVINVFNPKVALFFLAFLPQFIDTGAPAKALAFVVLGCLFNFNSLFVNIPVAWPAAHAGRRMRSHRAAARWLTGTIGALFVVLAGRLAMLERN